MGHARTKAKHIDLLMERCKSHSFQPFHVKRDSIGYIYNRYWVPLTSAVAKTDRAVRIWAAIKLEALLVAADGAASPQEVDEIFKGVLKTPKRPFEEIDVVGLDVVLDIEQHYAQARTGLPTASREYLKGLTAEESLG